MELRVPKNTWFAHFFLLHKLHNFLLKITPKFPSQHNLLPNPQVYLSSTRHSQEQTSGTKSPLSRQDTTLRRSTAAAPSGYGIAACSLNDKEPLSSGNSLCHWLSLKHSLFHQDKSWGSRGQVPARLSLFPCHHNNSCPAQPSYHKQRWGYF